MNWFVHQNFLTTKAQRVLIKIELEEMFFAIILNELHAFCV